MPLLETGVLALAALLCPAAAFALDPGGWKDPPVEARIQRTRVPSSGRSVQPMALPTA